MYTFIIIGFICFTIAYLCGLFDSYKAQPAFHLKEENLLIIEHLTQFKNKTKNYRNIPLGLSSYRKNILVHKEGNSVNFTYEFPLIEKYSTVFKCQLIPEEISPSINYFGIPQHLIKKVDQEKVTINTDYQEEHLKFAFPDGCWFFNSYSNWGVDYSKLVKQYSLFCLPIAKNIVESLERLNKDTYFNRVQSALNFVQFIPYGRPNFDTSEWYYHEIAIPQESFILGYSDCDSKSVLLATILVHLIPKENILLIDCMVRSKNENTNGAHMMLAVSDIHINGENIYHNSRNFILLETTAPCVMGKSDWEELVVNNIIALQ